MRATSAFGDGGGEFRPARKGYRRVAIGVEREVDLRLDGKITRMFEKQRGAHRIGLRQSRENVARRHRMTREFRRDVEARGRSRVGEDLQGEFAVARDLFVDGLIAQAEADR